VKILCSEGIANHTGAYPCMRLFPIIVRPIAVLASRLPLFLSFIIGYAAPVVGQEGVAPKPTYTVRGSIINKFSSQPVARALVILQGQASEAILTDREGRFEFANVPAGTCTLMVSRPGFSGSTRHAFAPERPRIQVGPSMTDVIIGLLPTGTITGQVTLSTSDSAENIQVHLLQKTIRDGHAFWQTVQIRSTNGDGIYFFGDLEAGTYRVYTSGSIDPDPEPAHSRQRWGFPPEYLPNTGDSTDETAVLNLRPGQNQQADIMLSHEPFYPVTVAISNRTVGGRANLEVYDSAGHQLSYPFHYDQHEQVMRSNLPRGTYHLETQTFGSAQMFGGVEITVRNTPVTALLTLLPLNPLSVIIRRDFTHEDHGATNDSSSFNGAPDSISAGVNLTLRRVIGGISDFMGGSLRHPQDNPDNSAFILENVRPGTYSVEIQAFHGYVASITSGEVDLAQHPLVVGPGSTSSPIEIVLRDDSANLGVSLNQPVPANSNSGPLAYLSLIPEFETAWQAPENLPLTQEVMHIANLPPGTYRVLAFDEPREPEYTNPAAMRAYAGKGQRVTLAPSGSAQIKLDVISTDSQSQ